MTVTPPSAFNIVYSTHVSEQIMPSAEAGDASSALDRASVKRASSRAPGGRRSPCRVY